MCLQYGRERETKARQACLTLAVLGKLGDFAGEEKKNFHLLLLPCFPPRHSRLKNKGREVQQGK